MVVSFLSQRMNQGKRTPTITRARMGAEGKPISSIRTSSMLLQHALTVGFGITPNLLTFPIGWKALAGLWVTHLPPVGNCTPP